MSFACHRRGMATLMVLSMVGMFAALTVVVTMALAASVEADRAGRDRLAARLAAEAGITRACAALRAGRPLAAEAAQFDFVSSPGGRAAAVNVRLKDAGPGWQVTSSARLTAPNGRAGQQFHLRCILAGRGDEFRIVRHSESTRPFEE